MNTDKELTPEEKEAMKPILWKHLEYAGCIDEDDFEEHYNNGTLDYEFMAMKEYGQQEREDQKKKDDLIIHTAYNSGYEAGKKEANEWISVKGNLPEKWRRLWVYTSFVQYGVFKGTLFFDSDGEEIKGVTHYQYMRLPAPPQQGTK